MFEQALSAFDLKPTDFWMILAGMALFWAYYKISSSVLFTPLLNLFEARENATVGAQEGATETIEEAARLEQVYEESLTEARRKAVAQKMERLAAAGKEASSIIGEAENAAKEKTKSGRQELAEVETKLRQELSKDIDALASELAGKVLGGESTGGASL